MNELWMLSTVVDCEEGYQKIHRSVREGEIENAI